MSPNSYLLILNVGSSTLKFKVFDGELKEEVVGLVEKISSKNSFFIYRIRDQGSVYRNFPQGVENHRQAVRVVLENLTKRDYKIKMVGHRVVHGGEDFTAPTKINEKVISLLEKYNKLAPLHNPISLGCIKTVRELLPNSINLAVFDTAFFQTLPDFAYIYSLPFDLYKKYKIRRYGFHGLSHRYVAEEAAKKLKKPLSRLKLITCHLGAGASMAAIKKGKAIDTSMGFTPLEGLTMATRSGDLDPSILLYLIKELNFSPDEVKDLLNKKSGFKGISGLSSDLRKILIAAGYQVKDFSWSEELTPETKERAQLALKRYIFMIQKYIGAYYVILGGIDALVFTGGVGENSPLVRRLITRGLKSLPKFKKLVVATNEELAMAREIKKFLVNHNNEQKKVDSSPKIND